MRNNQALAIAIDDGKRTPKRIRFTVDALTALRPVEGRRITVYDSATPHLCVMLTPNDVRTFYHYAKVNGKPTRTLLGRFPGITIEQARNIAKKHTGTVAKGDDPSAAKRAARAESTFGVLFDDYMRNDARANKLRTADELQAQYDRHLTRWANKRLGDIDNETVRKVHRELGADSPYAANRLLALIRRVFNFAISRRGYSGRNPAGGVEKFAEQSRERYLEPSELPDFMAAVDASDDDLRDFVKLALFTGARRSNLMAKRFDDVDHKRAVW
ncbi:MAG: tyrosine-type recombinase/integrase, partial [Phycisphaerae bacterium]